MKKTKEEIEVIAAPVGFLGVLCDLAVKNPQRHNSIALNPPKMQ